MAKKSTDGSVATVTAKESTTQKRGVTYSFGGEYYSKKGKEVRVKNYNLSVTFPEALQAPLSVFKKSISTQGHPVYNLMCKSYPDFSKVRTYSVLGVKNNTTNTKNTKNVIELMDLEQLKKYITDNDLIIDTIVYDDRVELVREAIKQAESAPEEFTIAYNEAVKDYEYRKELEKLNPIGNPPDGDGEDIDDLLGDLDGEEDGDGDVE